MDATIRIGDEERAVRVLRASGRRLRIAFDGGEPVSVRVRRLADGELALEQEDGGVLIRTRLAGLASGDERTLWVEGRLVRARRVEADGGSEAEEAAGLSATIPSVVLEVLVAAGDEVREGQKLLLLESMKMVIPILAPHDGQIAELHCAEGDSVAPGVPLLAFQHDAGREA